LALIHNKGYYAKYKNCYLYCEEIHGRQDTPGKPINIYMLHLQSLNSVITLYAADYNMNKKESASLIIIGRLELKI